MAAPRLRLYLHHPAAGRKHLPLWRKLGGKALPHCLAASRHPDTPLHTLGEIEISFVTDEAILQVHGAFLNDPTPTDVITFHHGEILVSLDTATRQAPIHQETFEREVLLYIIHGLLHLGGWEDLETEERAEMHTVQQRILEEVWSGRPGSAPSPEQPPAARSAS